MKRALLLAVLLAGCAGEPPAAKEPVWVGPPEDGGGFVECPGQGAIEVALPGLRAVEVNESGGRGPGLHRVDASTVLWVWADYRDTPRRDTVLRLNPVTVHREPDGSHSVCTRVEVGGELFTDGEPRTYAVGARFSAARFPEGPTRWVVNWVAACPACDHFPSGNATATFD